MSTPFQNRIVGTVIVAAAAIIFLPDLLDGKKKTYQEQFDVIPQPPKVENVTTPKEFPEQKLNIIDNPEVVEDEQALDDEPELPQNSSDTNQTIQASETLTITTMAKPEQLGAEPKVEQSVEPIKQNVTGDAWVIQLGSFSKKKNVDELVKKLTNAGYVVFTKPVKTKNRTLTKVFVGPDINKSNLEKQIPELAKIANVTGKIAKYSPTK
ncbi:SPOR domain-containing protein [Thalassotalea sp. LPB0316]|uniref:SPOR domain-containing protein n=1 Tax=Thalassotalea sp. LPB0316 TaxID=2769490 RepID=UPI001868DA4C|nr:SPOR domain-containing protein [Thalassotalea sp. LPB0316]QOL25276.1 SPOR domain-containing protein [Thalassotalea sp. LPB0316]